MGGAPPPMQHNRNVAIHGNRFSFIRDNAIEPEKGAQNWYVYDNAFYNIHATFSMDRVVKCTVFLADISEWPAVNEVYRTFFEEPFPARSAVAGSGLALGARVELECIATVE